MFEFTPEEFVVHAADLMKDNDAHVRIYGSDPGYFGIVKPEYRNKVMALATMFKGGCTFSQPDAPDPEWLFTGTIKAPRVLEDCMWCDRGVEELFDDPRRAPIISDGPCLCKVCLEDAMEQELASAERVVIAMKKALVGFGVSDD